MSMLDVGAQCAICPLVDFLPTTCPSCHETFCITHVHAHGCTISTTSSHAIAGPSSFARKAQCDLAACRRPTLEAIGGVDGGGTGIARAVKCPGCQGAFCVVHRHASDHACTAPTAEEVRADGAVARKAKAQDVLAKHFPDAVGRIVPKPPPAKVIERKKLPSPPRLPPSLQPAPEKVEEVKKVKTKAEKLHELHVRKVRSLATALVPGQKADDRDRRFFELAQGVHEAEAIRKWQEDGKWGKPDRYWVLSDTPLGKVFDVKLAKDKVPRPNSSDPAQALSLEMLHAPPDSPRTVTSLDLSQHVACVSDGSLLVLTRRWAS